jgi:uncharacterized protein YjbI with pentapeptide repeats
MATYAPELKDIDINSSAAELRSYTLAFVSFLLYVLIAAASTEHEQLLRISTVTLPLLNINIPIVQFYLVSPLLILVLHFHLLLQHFLFSQQYYSFDAALKIKYPDRADRVQYMKNISGNLSLVHLLGGYQKTFIQILLVGIVAICLLIFPLFDLWFLQAKFLPFHNTDYTNWQCLMVVIDCLMLLVLLPKILDKNDNSWQWWASIISPIFLINRAYLILIKAICLLLYIFNQLFLNFLRHFFYHSQFAGFRFFIITVSSRLTSTIHNLQYRYHTALLIRIISIKHFLATIVLFIFLSSLFILSIFVSTLPQFQYDKEKKEYSNMFISFVNNDKKWLLYSDKSIDLFINDREKWLLKDMRECDEKNIDKFSFMQAIFNICKIQIPNNAAENSLHVVSGNSLNIYNIVKGDSLDDYSARKSLYDLARNSLLLTAILHEKIANNNPVTLLLFRNLDLSEKIITAEEHLSHELENTFDKSSTLEKIAGITLNNRDLRYANFNQAKLPKADLRDTNLQGANLMNANMQGAYLSDANMQGAHLSAAKLQGAILDYANLQGAHLSAAKLQAAILINANLQDAHLQSANLQGAHLSTAKLQGAYLHSANLQGAHLSTTNLHGANLMSANMQDAYLMDANLQGAILIDANLQDAHVQSANLQGANLSTANLQGTDLRFTHLQGANLTLVRYGEYIDPETKQSSSTKFPIDEEKKAAIHCLTNDDKLPICKQYDETDTQTLNKITAYWINDLACSDKWIAKAIIINYLNNYEFKNYLISLLNKKLGGKTYLGIKNLPDEFKQEILNIILEK